MNYRIKDLTDFLESHAPLHLQESYDNAGLLVGQHDTTIKSVLVALDTTEAVIEEAMRLGANLVVAHHPIIFGGIKRLNGYNYVEKALLKAIKNDVAIYATHTNLDNVYEGVNQEIAKRLGLQNTKILSPKQENIGAGMIGDLPQALPEEAFLWFLSKAMQTAAFKYTRWAERPIQKVALCGGAGSFLIKEAYRQGADVYITSDLKYHEFFEAQGQMLLVDLGHYESEQFTQDLLCGWLKEAFSSLSVQKTTENTNPVRWFGLTEKR